MNLDQLTIEIRPRRPWEAVDLGIRMAQRWWRQLTTIFVLLSLPVWLLLAFIPQEYWFRKLFLFWLLLPLFERPLLLFLSKAVFNEVLSIKQVLKQSPGLFLKQVIPTLSWRRLSPSRSMDMPVSILEGLNGSRRSARIAILHREDASPAAWITVIGHHCVYAITITLFIISVQFLNHFFDTPWWQFVEEESWDRLLSNWATIILFNFLYIGFVLVTPFYVAAGFALYLNRRIRLEAWDVEIAFRKMVQKREQSKSTLRNSVLVSLLLCVFSYPLLSPGVVVADIAIANEVTAEVLAEQPIEFNSASDEAKFNIERILSGDDFNQKEIDEVWHFPFDFNWNKGDSDNKFLENTGKFFEALIRGLATWGELILWVCVLGLVFYLVFRYRHWLAELVPHKAMKKSVRAETLFGMNISRESLPDDIGAAAISLWQEGKHRESLALLYRACLSQLVGRGLELEDGDTELECLQASKASAQALGLNESTVSYFSRLTSCWRKLAYGHILPDETEALSLCANWQGAWQKPESQGAD